MCGAEKRGLHLRRREIFLGRFTDESSPPRVYCPKFAAQSLLPKVYRPMFAAQSLPMKIYRQDILKRDFVAGGEISFAIL